MVSIKKQLHAYILLESLIALGVLVTITSLVLSHLGLQQRAIAEQVRQQEVLNLAIMAVQTGQERLSLDGVSVEVARSDSQLTVYSQGRVVMSLVKD